MVIGGKAPRVTMMALSTHQGKGGLHRNSFVLVVRAFYHWNRLTARGGHQISQGFPQGI